MHVTCRIDGGLPSLRKAATVQLLMDYLARVCEREGFRIVEYSIQGNHIHLLCEAMSSEALSAAMNGILSGMARILNGHWGRRGRVFADRYHAELITTPTQCRHALLYVLANAKKHGYIPLDAGADPCSTAPWFAFDSHPPDAETRSQPPSPGHGSSAQAGAPEHASPCPSTTIHASPRSHEFHHADKHGSSKTSNANRKPDSVRQTLSESAAEAQS